MGIFFTGSELVNIAIGIERSGAAFYDTLAKSARNEASRVIYEYLALEEKKHIEIFQNMLGSLADYAPPETYTEEYDRYLKALIDSAVFRDDQTAREMAQKSASEAKAIQIAISAEKDSILFYSNLRELVRRSDREAVDKIIEEERSHLRQLSDLMKGFSKR
ncbi:MAG TPA: ferritin family protein [Dehalococcoidia bacterium]|nr:ferritin family protein [Dehalococcoidia bacterium]